MQDNVISVEVLQGKRGLVPVSFVNTETGECKVIDYIVCAVNGMFSTVYLCSCNEEDVVLYWNRTWEELKGFQPVRYVSSTKHNEGNSLFSGMAVQDSLFGGMDENIDEAFWDNTTYLNKTIAMVFCKEYQPSDLSAGGNLDFCKLEVIKEKFDDYCKAIHQLNIEPCPKFINDYFRDRRYEILEREYAIDPSCTVEDLMEKTRFNFTMTSKFLERKRGKQQIRQGTYSAE